MTDWYNLDKSKPFFPNGISERKWNFTAEELVDIYIKGNCFLYTDLVENGFGDEDFPRDIDEWQHVVLTPFETWGRSPREMCESAHAIATLVGDYLEIDNNLAVIGYAALSNTDIGCIECLIEAFEKVSNNYYLQLYYNFFECLEDIRQSNYDLAKSFKDSNRPPIEWTAFALNANNRLKMKLQVIVEQVKFKSAKSPLANSTPSRLFSTGDEKEGIP